MDSMDELFAKLERANVEPLGEDKPSWKLTKNGRFIIRSQYGALELEEGIIVWPFWET